MGIYSTNYLPPETKKTQVVEFLKLLGFTQVTSSHLYHYNENNLEQVTAIVADLVKVGDKYLKVEITTTVWRSVSDHEIHNSTIKQLKLRFGGKFTTDSGPNKYLEYDDIERRKDDAGCNLAYFHFRSNLNKISVFLSQQKAVNIEYKIDGKKYRVNTAEANVTIALPFLVSILEEFLRNIYISLLTYSTKKKDIFKSSRISNELLYDVTTSDLTIEKVIAQSKSFQNIVQINSIFKELDSKINFIDLLKRTNPQKNNLERLENLIETRHVIIHQAKLSEGYKFEHFQNDIRLIEDIVVSFYSHLVKIYNWEEEFNYY